ncbi:MAG: Flp pilus assembly complex ATPase component TadA, partial [Gammaproteobacteria bacterium]|nr:Flp pilus assembly complex ATPase component TadA [Gammaproteobacteria bacterium]
MTAAIGEWLVQADKISQNQLRHVRSLQAEKGGPLGPLLVQLGFISERELATTLASEMQLALVAGGDYADLTEFGDLVSAEFLRQHHVAPLQADDGRVKVAVADPSDPFIIDALQLAFGQPVELHVGVISDIQQALARALPAESAPAFASDDADLVVERNVDDITHLRDMASEAPVIRRVNQMVARALELRASDIHIEPFERELVVRYRVDGVLRAIRFPGELPPEAIVSRIKVLASLDIAERRLPQDGRIKLRAEGREIDMRISTVPTLHGESVVMRLLDRGDVPLDFESLGFTGETLSA